MKQLFLATLFISFFTSVSAQLASLSGVVTTKDGIPVNGATVKVVGTSFVTITDINGFYQFKNIPYGKQQMEVTSLEIASGRYSVHVRQSIQQFNLQVDSKRSVDIEGVEVQGKSEKRDIETSGFAVNVVETREASLRNLQTNELLDRTVGVRIRQNGGIGSNVEYNLNGMSGRSVGIFIDGIEISTYGSSFNLNNIPPAMIERIEVYKGVLPAHLSGDLMGGAINVVLKKGFSQNNLTVAVSYGSFNTFQSDVSGMYRNAKTGLTVRGSAFYTNTDNSYRIWGKFARNTMPDGTMEYVTAKRFWDGYRATGGRFEVGFTDVKWADQFFIGYNGSDIYNEIQHGQTMSQPYMGRFNEAQAHVLNLTYDKKDLFVSGLQLIVNANYSSRETYIQDTVSWVYNWSGERMIGFHGRPLKTRLGAQQGEPTMALVNRKILTTRTNLSYNIVQGHRLSLNHVYYTVDRYDSDALKTVVDRAYRSDSDLQKHVTALNYESQVLDDKLRTNLFAKHYFQDITQWQPTHEMVNGESVFVRKRIDNNKSTLGYGVAISYSLYPRAVLIGSTEKAVRMPSETEIFGSPDENILANIGIRPEISNNYNIGFRLGAYDFGKHKISLSTNAFWRNVRDRIMRQPMQRNDEEFEVSPFINMGLSQSLGFEGELGYIYNNNLNVMVNFSKFNSLFKQKYDPNTGLEMSQYNEQLPNEPFFTINGNVQYRLSNVFQKSSILNLFYNTGYVAPFYVAWGQALNSKIPTQFSHDFGLSYRFPNNRIVASFDAKNIFNAQVYDNFAVQKPGRSFFVKLNYTINKFL